MFAIDCKTFERRRGMVTIYDIARRVGCAPSTVSRALGDAYGVREKTKKEILLAAKEMNYVPDSTAKNLKSKRSWNIGVIMYVEGLSGLKHYLFAEILDSFANVVESHNYDITLFSKNIVLSKKSLLEHCRSKRLDGVFIVCGDFTAKPIKELLASEIPVVTVDYFNAGMENINCVTSDNRRKMYDLTEYILENGHRDILYIMGQDVYVTQERVKGFRAALKAYGVPFREEMLLRGEYYNLDLTYRIIKEVFSRKNRPSAVIMPDDYCSIAAYDALAEFGLRIPEDVSLAGFDGLEIGQRMTPPLTTVRQNTVGIGEYAANKLLSLIDGTAEEEASLKTIDGMLIPGKSVRKLS